MKGPVLGSTVCVYALTAGAKGAQIPVTAGTGATGSVANGCYVTAADGTYNLRLPSGTSGDVLVEATGGSFCSNESAVAGGACSGGASLVNLGASMMTSVASVPASGTATVYTTPLTTAAVDIIRARGLSSANFGGEFATLAGQLLGNTTNVTPAQAPTLATQPYLATVADFLRTGGTFSAAVTSLAAGTTTNITLVDATAVTRGLWSGTANGPDGSTGASVVVLPDLTTWIVHQNANEVLGVTKATASATAANTTTASVTASGTYYPIPDMAGKAVTLTGTTNKLGAFQASSTAGTTTATYTLTAANNAATAATAVNAQGTWTGTLGDRTNRITWNVTAATSGNNVEGNSTVGCTFAGTLRPHASGMAVYNVSVTENCAGTIRTLDGIALLVNNNLNVRYTTGTGTSSRGGVLSLGRPAT